MGFGLIGHSESVWFRRPTKFRFVGEKVNFAADSPLVSMSLGFWQHLTLLIQKCQVPTPMIIYSQ